MLYVVGTKDVVNVIIDIDLGVIAEQISQKINDSSIMSCSWRVIDNRIKRKLN